MNNLLKIFGKTIRDLRKAKKLSQEDLADICNLHRTYISGIELGKRNISLINILLLANALEVAPSDLLQEFNKERMKKFKEDNVDLTLL